MEVHHSDTADRILEVFGETVIIRRDPAGQPIDAAVIEEIVPPGVGAPLHRHSREDEVFYVIEGTFRIWRGEEVLDVGPGGVALLPRDQIHTFQNVGGAPVGCSPSLCRRASSASSRRSSTWLGRRRRRPDRRGSRRVRPGDSRPDAVHPTMRPDRSGGQRRALWVDRAEARGS